jgi:hypothetical protein
MVFWLNINELTDAFKRKKSVISGPFDSNIGKMFFEAEAITNKDYIELLRQAIEEFRVSFIDWMAGFDVWDYVKDSWGLFNPPGINAHDKDPDDDIPFDPNNFFDDN